MSHRVVEPRGALPYEARRLDPSAPLAGEEIEVAVEALHLDSASWRQLRESAETPAEIGGRIMEIVSAAGKMHNPVTGSGGTLVGEVLATGTASAAPRVGSRVLSLISLTCTPLELRDVGRIDPDSPIVPVAGRAILPAPAACVEAPDDLDEHVALSVADVAGAPAWTGALACPGDRVVVVGGGGRAGLLACAAAREGVEPGGEVLALCWPPATRAGARAAGAHAVAVDCTDALAVEGAVLEALGGPADLVVVCTNVAGCEGGAILACAPSGEVLFFSMATSFTAVALIAESVLAQCRLTVGNGYRPGHAEFAFGLVRRQPHLQELLTG